MKNQIIPKDNTDSWSSRKLPISRKKSPELLVPDFKWWVSENYRGTFLGVPIIRTVIFGVYIGVPLFWETTK